MKPKWKWIIGLGLVILTVGLGYAFSRKKTDPSGATYRAVKVQKGKFEVKILSTGTVQPENRVDIKPPIAGRVEEILVKEGQKVKKGKIIAWISSSERAALLDAATARGPEELKEWEALYKPTPVLAPIDGTVIQRTVESGQTLTASDSILSMSDRLTVKAQVDETDIAHIRLKQNVTIVLDAYAQQAIPAHVDQIAFDAKTVNNVTNYVVDVLPNKTPEYMRSGMTANVTFEVASKEDTLYVPVDAIKISAGRPSVLVPNPADEKSPLSKEIETGLSDGRKIEVLSGLIEGESVLVQEFKLNSEKKGGGSPLTPGMGGRPKGR